MKASVVFAWWEVAAGRQAGRSSALGAPRVIFIFCSPCPHLRNLARLTPYKRSQPRQATGCCALSVVAASGTCHNRQILSDCPQTPAIHTPRRPKFATTSTMADATETSAGDATAPANNARRGRGRGGSQGGNRQSNENPASTGERGRGKGGRRGGRGRGNRGGRNADADGDGVGDNAPTRASRGNFGARLTAGANSTTNDAESKGKERVAAAEEEDEGEVCFICASPIDHHAVSPCNHRTCHICSLRLRALYKSKACAHCRVSLPGMDRYFLLLTVFSDTVRLCYFHRRSREEIRGVFRF